ncbi:hypothetical protein PAEN110709_00660 [Paenibacillus endophyticus]
MFYSYGLRFGAIQSRLHKQTSFIRDTIVLTIREKWLLEHQLKELHGLDQLLQWVLVPGILITLVLSAIFSFKSRRASDARTRGLFSARMNISMGIMLMFIALVQLFLSGESTLRIVIGAIFLVIGVFNLFAGLRNLGAYSASRQ